MAKKRKKKKSSGCLGFVVVTLILVLCVAVFIYSDLFSKIRISIEHRVYPLKYEQEIIEAADEYNLEPGLLSAVIFAESRFQENATSHVGAMGLMQMMPSTFAEIQQRRGESLSSDSLYDPYISIDYGASYLGYLYNHFGDIYTACAAYNAGIGTIEGWLLDEDYSEDGVTLYYIPYGETADYVEKIRDATVKYNELYFADNQY